MLGASGLMLAVKFFADRIPGVDTQWDVMHTQLRIAAGAPLVDAGFGADSATVTAAAALLSGTLAATNHFAEATTRTPVNTSPEPFSNIGLSLARDAAVPAMLWLAFTHPWPFFALLAIALALMAVLLWKFGRFLGQMLLRVSGGSGGQAPTTTSGSSRGSRYVAR